MMKCWAIMVCMFVGGSALAAPPSVDFSGVQKDLAGQPTRVLVLGTLHIAQQDEEVLPTAHLSLLLDRLARFAPDLIAIESLPGLICDQTKRFESEYPDVWDTYCIDPQPALDSLDLTIVDATRQLAAMRASGEAELSSAERRRLAALYWATGNPYSAVVQWRSLPEPERKVGDGVDTDLLQALRARMASRNESNVIAAALASRLGHERVWPMDDHTADRVIARAKSDPYAVLSEEVWGKVSPESFEHYRRGLELLGSPEGVVQAYRHFNSAESQRLSIAGDFGAAAAHSAVTRQYVSWWQARGLRMAANVIEAAGNSPGATVLVLVGASHKAYFEAYLDQMHDIELVSVDDVLGAAQ